MCGPGRLSDHFSLPYTPLPCSALILWKRPCLGSQGLCVFCAPELLPAGGPPQRLASFCRAGNFCLTRCLSSCPLQELTARALCFRSLIPISCRLRRSCQGLSREGNSGKDNKLKMQHHLREPRGRFPPGASHRPAGGVASHLPC